MTRNQGTVLLSGLFGSSVVRAMYGLLALGLLIAGCESPTDDTEFLAEEMQVLARPAALELPLSTQQVSTVPQRLIRSGSARVEVEDLDIALEAAQDLAVQAQGFVAGSELQEGREGARTASLVVRVPSDSFDGVLEGLSELGRVLSVSVNTTDVSREYLDVETRLAVQEETVARLRELATRSGDLEDLLAAERELGRALTELESFKGQLRYYNQRIAESDLRLALIEPGAVVSSGAFRPIGEAFRNATAVFAQSVASLVYILVFVAPWAVLALLLWPLLRRVRQARRERRADSAA